MNRLVIHFLCFAFSCTAQRIEVRDAPPISMPGKVDSNSPAFWMDGELHLLNSTGDGPILSRGRNQFQLAGEGLSSVVRLKPWPTWIEAVWVDPTGVVFAWYHQEHEHICGAQRPAQPQIGAAISYDRGKTFHDVGTVLSAPDAPDCSAKNGYFAGGHGDFSVVPDRNNEYFYFFFGNYGGATEEQGVAVARMAYSARFQPVGNVWKYRNGDWRQPGVGGRTTPIFPAKVGWQQANTDSFWGPSVHWNKYLDKFVMLMNRSCCTAGWPQAGIYASFSADLSDITSWAAPTKILDNSGWYPQVLGVFRGESDSVAGRKARLYIYGQSSWEIVFRRNGLPDPVSDDRPLEEAPSENAPPEAVAPEDAPPQGDQ
jgi:hypothetical protein